MSVREKTMRLLREPLLHFLLLGAALFIVFEATDDSPVGPGDAIEVTPAFVEHLVSGFERTWRRPPDDQELLKLVQDQVRDEVFYREAIALGLDQDDTLIRRRLRQKLESLQAETAERPVATGEDLERYFAAHSARYAQPPKIGFDQVLVAEADDAAAKAREILTRLQAGADPAAPELGDPSPQPTHFEPTAEPLLALAFGESFVEKLADIEAVGIWTGPIQSKLGLHLVRVNARVGARVPELAEVREAVERDWQSEQLRRWRDDAFQELQQRYPVTVTVPGEQGARIAETLGAPQVP